MKQSSFRVRTSAPLPLACAPPLDLIPKKFARVVAPSTSFRVNLCVIRFCSLLFIRECMNPRIKNKNDRPAINAIAIVNPVLICDKPIRSRGFTLQRLLDRVRVKTEFMRSAFRM